MNESQTCYRILFVEDCEIDYRLVKKYLETRLGEFDIKWVDCVEDAIELLSKENFDAILTDLRLPDLSGTNVVNELRNHSAATPIVVLTGVEDDAFEEIILSSGANDYVLKSDMRPRVLRSALQHAIQRQQSLNRTNHLVRRLRVSSHRLKKQSLQLKRKNSKLRKLYRTAREFVDNVSHDLRTPLTVIKDYVSILRAGMAGGVNEEQQRLLGKVAVRADDLNHMVDDVLDASKLEAGLLGAWRRPVTVQEVINDASSLLKQRASIKGVKLETDCPDSLPLIYCDSEKAVRVITNLAINALKFSEPGQTVKIQATHDPVHSEVTIGVVDNGPGISPDALQQIFERFEQLNDNVKTTVKGFGLGLNIAQRLTRINLGSMQVTSKVGEGSKFYFTIPVADPLEVLRRWLDLQGTIRLPLRAMEIKLDSSGSEHDTDDFDRFVNCLLRDNDILFRINPRTWILVMPISARETEKWEKRFQADFERFNRNRPKGHLPKFTKVVKREWHPPISKEDVCEDFEKMQREPTKLIRRKPTVSF